MDRKQEMHSVLKSTGLNRMETVEERQLSTHDQDLEVLDVQLGAAQTFTTTMDKHRFI